MDMICSHRSYPSGQLVANYYFGFNFAVQASIAANTWVVSGSPQTKSMALRLSM
jgi:hypothetical protein